MIFSEACCEDLRLALTCGEGEDRAFLRLSDEGDEGPLALSCYFVWGETMCDNGTKGPAKARVSFNVYFCPFCGTQLQTKEGVDNWTKDELAKLD